MKTIPNILVIFDEYLDIKSLHKKLSELRPKNVQLFPLTANWRLIHDLQHSTKSMFGSDIEIKLIESAELMDKEVAVVRESVTKWSADFGNHKIAGKSIKEWFELPKSEVSSWWFSLLSEKNSYKTNVFFRLAQLQAIDRIMASNTIDNCFLSVCENNFSRSIGKICQRHSINILGISSLKRKKSFKERTKSYLNKESAFNFTLKALIHFFLRISRAIRAKCVMGSIKSRVNKLDNSVLFVSYFPAVDKLSAKNGILKNKYAIPLQEKLSRMNKKIIWIWMYWFLDEQTYGNALSFAKKFKKGGESNFFLEEFMSLKMILKVFLLWIHQYRVYLKLKERMPTELFYVNLSVPEGAVFIENLMAQSFISWTGLAGILYFELYKEVFSHFPFPSHCIYYLEMQAWEKALNAAKQLNAPQIKSIGFQHGIISRNHFSFFHHPSEIVQEERSISPPVPNILACNGDIPMDLMSRCQYPNLTKVEAVRHLYLIRYLDNFDPSNKQNIVLIAGSTDYQETRALISLFNQAFPKPNGFTVWLKGHPVLPFDQIIDELKIDLENCNYLIQEDSIEKLLNPTKILIVGSSNVAVEGLARQCRVITPIFSDSMFMSPLDGFEEFYTKVRNPQEMRTAIEQYIQGNEGKRDLSEITEFISRYLCLDPSLKRWEKLLTESSSI